MILSVVVLFIIIQSSLFCYIDPGTGSLLFSALFGIIGTLFFLSKALLIKLKTFSFADKINKKETDCDKSKKLAKRPIIELITSNNFKLNEWNKNGGTIKVKLKNGGNSYYKEKDINSVEWYSIDGSINSVNNELEITDNMNTTLNVMINFEDVSYVKETKVMVDVDAPIYKSSNLKDSFLVTFEDNYFLNKKYYYFSENNEAPNKSDFKDRIEDLACDKTYNVWSYATDMAGNESEIQYLGNYTRCITISSGSVSEE